MTTDGRCVEYLPDHTDHYRCGAPAVRGGYCAEHIKDAEERARKKVRQVEEQLRGAKRELEELTTESGRIER